MPTRPATTPATAPAQPRGDAEDALDTIPVECATGACSCQSLRPLDHRYRAPQEPGLQWPACDVTPGLLVCLIADTSDAPTVHRILTVHAVHDRIHVTSEATDQTGTPSLSALHRVGRRATDVPVTAPVAMGVESHLRVGVDLVVKWDRAEEPRDDGEPGTVVTVCIRATTREGVELGLLAKLRGVSHLEVATALRVAVDTARALWPVNVMVQREPGAPE